MSQTLVTYFSASGVTANAAKILAQAAGADLYEIKPEVPYTRADLNWMEKKSRSTVEMNDPSSRPAINGKVEHMDQYQNIFIGFPIWWYREPSIIDTFLFKFFVPLFISLGTRNLICEPFQSITNFVF